MEEECSVDVLKLEHDPPEDFGVCVCECGRFGNYLFAFFRDLLIVIHFSLLILAFVSSELGFYGVAISTSLIEDDSSDQYWDYLPWFCKVYWALFSAVLPSSMLSCVVYWVQIHKVPDCQHLMHTLLNTLSPTLIIFEFICIAFPLRMLNCFYFVILYIVYIIFTLIYQKSGGTGVNQVPIYNLLDWNSPAKAVMTTFVGLAIGIGAYFFFCLMSMAKLACRSRYQFY